MAKRKFQKWEQMEFLVSLLKRHTGGMTEAEIADTMGVHRRTVNNYLRELESKGRAKREGIKHKGVLWKRKT